MNVYRLNSRLREPRGLTFIILLLFLLPVLLGFMYVSLEHTRIVYGSDVDLQQAVEDAVRAAAMSVDAVSQAHAVYLIDPDKAHEMFRYTLAYNLGLEPTTLAPQQNTGLVESPSYVLLIYNGNNEYGVSACRKYTSTNPYGTDLVCDEVAFPKEVAIGSDIVFGSGELSTVLESPSCVALVEAKMTDIITGENAVVSRWATGRIVSRK